MDFFYLFYILLLLNFQLTALSFLRNQIGFLRCGLLMILLKQTCVNLKFYFLVKTFFHFLSIVDNDLNLPCIASDVLCDNRLNAA